MVFSNSRAVSIEQLVVGDKVTNYNLKDGSFSSVTVQQISTLAVDSIVEIKTTQGSILSSPNQLFYDDAKQDFVQASALTDQNVLISQNLGKISCIGITQHPLKAVCYKLTLDWPHTFFASDLKVLAHNVAPAVVLLPGLAEAFVGVSIIAYAHIQGTTEIFSDLALGKTQVLRNVDLFAKQYRKKEPSNTKLNIPYILQPPSIAGIKPDSSMYNHVRQYPQLYSPFIITAEIDSCGNIIGTIWSIKLDSCDGKTNWFSKQTIGREVFAYSNPVIKVFMQEEDKKQLDQLRDFTKTWPTDITKNLFDPYLHISTEAEWIRIEYGDFEKIIYGIQFGVHALRQMVLKNIPPSHVIQAIKNATCTLAKDSKHVIFCDKQSDTTAVVEKASRKVINVGRAGDMATMNEMPPKEDPNNTKSGKDTKNKNQLPRPGDDGGPVISKIPPIVAAEEEIRKNGSTVVTAVGDAAKAAGKAVGSTIRERGKTFEDFIIKKLGGRGSFNVGGREFDGAVGNVWYEAKSGQFWDMLLTNKDKLNRFREGMGRGLRIARDNGATYHLHSNTPIPRIIKKWLTEKGIPFTEWK